MNGPIWISCEGAGFRGHLINDVLICAMCGERFFAVADGSAVTARSVPATSHDITPHHERDDILARIRRGDFDPQR